MHSCPDHICLLVEMEVNAVTDGDSDDDIPQLSNHALAALQEFYSDQAALELREDKPVTEDWGLSQFWYDEDTADQLVKESLAVTEEGGSIAFLSSPTAFSHLLKVGCENRHAVLFEYDTRFREKYGTNFQYYDYKNPLAIDEDMQKRFDFILADPPFLDDDCLLGFCQTVRLLARNESTKIMFCTGAIMEDSCAKFLQLKLTDFLPKHSSKLSNEFRCYANYDVCLLKS